MAHLDGYTDCPKCGFELYIETLANPHNPAQQNSAEVVRVTMTLKCGRCGKKWQARLGEGGE